MCKKVLLVFIVAVLAASYAQAQFNFGVRGGVGLTNVYQKKDGEMKGLDYKPGFQLGIVSEYALLDYLFLQPGISFSRQGMKTVMSISKNSANFTWDLNYIQVPINIQIRNNSNKLYIQAGPYLGYGINGKLKISAVSGGTSESVTEKITFGGKGTKVSDFNAFDFGLGVGTGFRFGNLQTGLEINYGLVNITPVNDVIMKNLCLAFTVTYMFGK